MTAVIKIVFTTCSNDKTRSHYNISESDQLALNIVLVV